MLNQRLLKNIPPNRWRHWHRWLSLAVGLQLVIWCLSGAYMVVTDLDFIHGDHLLSTSKKPAIDAANMKKIPGIIEKYPQAETIELTSQWIKQQWLPVFSVSTSPPRLLDAETLAPITLTQEDIAEIAKQRFMERRAIKNMTLLQSGDNFPSEIPASVAPIWQVTFAGITRPTLYLHPNTGEVVTQRHNYWRVFDFAWMLHIMDYENRVDIQTNLLKVLIIGNVVFFITGMVLIVVLLRPSKQTESNS